MNAPAKSKNTDTATFEVEPIGPTLGAEIRGLDLRLPLSAETFRAFETVLIEYKIIYMRDQPITTAQHVAMGRRFGELEVHPLRPRANFQRSSYSTITRTIRCCRPMSGIPTRPSANARPDIRSCAARNPQDRRRYTVG